MIGQVKLRPTDRLYTKIQRIRFNYTCQKCGRKYTESGNLQNLGVSHYYGRAREATRYDDDNVTLLCNLPCHRNWEGEKRGEYTKYMIERLGEDGFNSLTLKANSYKKRDDAATLEVLKKRLREIGED